MQTLTSRLAVVAVVRLLLYTTAAVCAAARNWFKVAHEFVGGYWLNSFVFM